MTVVEWLSWFVIETIKYILIIYGIFGFDLRKKWTKHLAFLYPVGVMALNKYIAAESFNAQMLWWIILCFFVFEGKIGKKIQIHCIAYLLLNIMDILSWLIFMFVSKATVEESVENYTQLINTFAIFIWGIAAFLMREKRINVREHFENLPWQYFIMLFSGILSITFIVGIFQMEILQYEVTMKMQQALLFSCIIIAMFIFMVFGIFTYIVSSRNRLQEKNKWNEECIMFQRKYYEELMEKEEDLRGFRHDIRKHINVLQGYCENNMMEKVKEYVFALNGEFQELQIIRTGNVVADYFVNGVVNELEKEPKFNIVGRFPEEMRISDADFCILFGNAMENVKESLNKQEGKGKIELEIRHYKEKLFLTIANSALPKEGALLQTEKFDKKMHGYGTKNMKRIVDKYHGSIEWKYENSMFIVEIVI